MSSPILRNFAAVTASGRAGRLALWLPGIVLALMVGLLAHAVSARAVEGEARRHLDDVARGTQQRLQTAIQSYTSVLRGLAALFQSQEGMVSRQQFQRYVGNLQAEANFPAIEAMSYAPLVRDAVREDFIGGVRADRSVDPAGYLGFDIRPEGRRPDYTVLTYLEPRAVFDERAGTDIAATGPAQRDALARARDSGDVTVSGMPVLMQRPRPHLVFAMRLPVYRGGVLPVTVEARRAAYVGSVGVGFSLPRLVEDALGGPQAKPVRMALYAAGPQRAADGPLTLGDGDLLLYGERVAGNDARFVTVVPVDFNGSLWKAQFSGSATDLVDGVDRRLPLLALAAGTLGTLLIYSLFVTLYASRRGVLQERELLDTVLDNVDAYVYMKGRDRRYRYVNAKTAAALGRRVDEVIGQRDLDLLPRAQADQAWEGDNDIFTDRRRHADQIEFEMLDGTRRHLWRVRAPVVVGGEVVAVLGVSTDVTELHELKAQADAASQAKSEFLSNMSHEIRTPMNSIIGMTHLALQSTGEPKVRDYLDKIHHAGQHLLGIINRILDFSKIEAGHMQLDVVDFTLAALQANVDSQLGQAAAAKGLALRWEIDAALGGTLRGDPLRLEQVLLNFVGNAVKFSDHGQIVIAVAPAEAPGADTLVRFAVRDHGIGIAPEDLPSLFSPFHQADASTTRRYGGTGLGLVISKQLAELMGGSAGADSAPGQGSTFWFTARLARGSGACPADVPAPVPGAIAGARILLVEDNVFSQQVGRELLEADGAEVTVAGNGAEALNLLRGGARFDCVLMDVQMPVMDGYEATRCIRADAALAGTMVVAMTANVGTENRARCLAAGMNEFLTKPVMPELLAATVARCLGRGGVVQAEAAERAGAGGDAGVAERRDADVIAATGASADAGSHTGSGVAASGSSEVGVGARCDVDGIAAACAGADAGSHAGSGVAVSGSSEVGVGARRDVDGIAAACAAADAGSHTGSGVAASGKSAVGVDAVAEPVLLDLSVLEAMVGKSPERVRRFAMLFLDTAPKGLAQLDAALAADALEQASALAHRLKSSARTIGARGFADACHALERQWPDGGLEAARELAAVLHAQFAALERAIPAQLDQLDGPPA